MEINPFFVVLVAFVCTFIISYSLDGIGKKLQDTTEAYKARTLLLAKQDEFRTQVAAKRKEERNEEREQRYWTALWEKLQQMQLECSKGEDRRPSGYRLAARVALLWIRFSGIYEEYANFLEGFPHGGGKLTGRNEIIAEYVRRYMQAANADPLTTFEPDDRQWWEAAEEALSLRLRDLNTPTQS